MAFEGIKTAALSCNEKEIKKDTWNVGSFSERIWHVFQFPRRKQQN